MVKGNYYGVLGVSPEASEEEIKNRFNELSLTAHPDKGGDEEKYKKIQNIQKVYKNSTIIIHFGRVKLFFEKFKLYLLAFLYNIYHFCILYNIFI